MLDPCELSIELWRAKEAGRTHPSLELLFEPQEYVRRFDDGSVVTGRFGWGQDVLDNLAAIQREKTDRPAAEWLAAELRKLVETLRWSDDERRIEEALHAGRPVHLTLRFAAAELFALPWEYVRIGPKPLGALQGCLIRYEWPGTDTAIPNPDPPPEGGRIVVAWSAAGGQVPAAEHIDAIRQACRRSYHPFDEPRDVVPSVSLSKLRDTLAESPVAVLHILCHGGAVASRIESYGLVWNGDGDAGEREVIDAATLRELLADHAGSLRLVVLCACYGHRAGALHSRLGSVAQELHRAGIPAVLASRYPLSTAASSDLASVLYHELLVQTRSLEQAVLAVSRRLYERPNRVDWASMQLYACESGGSDSRPFVFRPYRGLLAFHEQHARYFFGRDAEVNETLRNLQALIDAKGAQKPRFLIVTGASGTGKSSLVLAGVVPELRWRDPRWIVHVMRPVDDWRVALARVRGLRKTKGAPVLVFVDQFEEVFTVVHKFERELFVQELWGIAQNSRIHVSVIATLRADFLARCGEIVLDSKRDLTLEDVAYDQAHRVFVPRMKREGIEKIIRRPAKMVGIELEAGLVKQMVMDARDEPGLLPLVEYTLDELWQRRVRGDAKGYTLTSSAYHDLGGVTGALAKKADAILAEFDDVRRRAARRLLVRLVDARDEASLDTRRRVPVEELRQGPAEAPIFEEVLKKLADERLVVVSRDEEQHTPAHGTSSGTKSTFVEIGHEELIRSWRQLREWLKEDRQMLADLDQLRAWVSEAKRYEKILEGKQLAYASALLERYQQMIDPEARQLIEQSEQEQVTRAAAARNARTASLMAGARELLARDQPAQATRLLLAVENSADARGWIELAYEALAVGLPKATLRGHRAAVNSVAWSPDGRHIATASADGTACVWNADGTGNPIVINGNVGAVAAWSPDGKRIVISSGDSTARVWNADGTGSPLVLKGHEEQILSAQWSPDGTRIVTASGDATARVWNADGSGDPVVLKGHEAWVPAAAWSPDGRRIVTASWDATRLWNADGSGETVVLTSNSPVESAAWSPDGNLLLTVTFGGIGVWNTNGAGASLVFERKGEDPKAAWSPDGARIVTISRDTMARVWNADGTDDPIVLKSHEGWVNSAAWSPDGTQIVTGSDDATARVWSADLPGVPLVLKHGDNGYAARSAAWSPDGKRVLTVYMDGPARVWSADVSSNPIVLTGNKVHRAAWSPDGNRIVSASEDNIVRVLNADGTGSPLILKGDDYAHYVEWSPDGKRIVAAYRGNTVWVWNADGNDPPIVLRGHEKSVYHAAWSPDGNRIVSASADKTARVWDADGGGDPIVLRGHEAEVYAAVWSPDGKYIATASIFDKTVRVWNADGGGNAIVLKGYESPDVRDPYAPWSPDGKRIVVESDISARVWNADRSGNPVALVGHEGSIVSAAWSPDGKRIVTASRDRTARVWNADGTGNPIVLKGHLNELSHAAWCPDGMRIVTASHDATARIWTLSIPDLQQALRNATTECLTLRQRQTYLGETETEAHARYEECERSHGRTPFYANNART